MQFHSHRSTYDHPKALGFIPRKMSFPEFYQTLLKSEPARFMPYRRQITAEGEWHRTKKPYYHIFPRIVEPLTKLDLSTVQGHQLSFPLKCLAFQFAANHEYWEVEDHKLRSMLICCDRISELYNNYKFLTDSLPNTPQKLQDDDVELTIWMDFQEKDSRGNPVYTWRRFIAYDRDWETVRNL